MARHLKGSVKVTALAAGQNAAALLKQAKEFKPALLGIRDEAQGAWLKGQLARIKGYKPRLSVGSQALEWIASQPGADMLLSSVVGAAGLLPTLKAIQSGKDIALANKETLVAGGELVRQEVKKAGVSILPVDSEHNAIFQCLSGIGQERELKRLILTGLGGPFRGPARRC